MEKMEAKHRGHEKLKHPMTKDQLEEVWEEQDHMEAKVINDHHVEIKITKEQPKNQLEEVWEEHYHM